MLFFYSIVEGRRVEVFESDPYQHKAKFGNREFYESEDVRENKAFPMCSLKLDQ